MNYSNKKAFSLLELIIVIFIGSIIVIYSTIYSKELYEAQLNNQRIAVLKIDLNASKIIIERNLPLSKDLLEYDGQTLFYDGKLLLENVSFFSKKLNFNNILQIDIELDNKIKQVWKFKLWKNLSHYFLWLF